MLHRHRHSESLMTSYLRMQAATAEPEVTTASLPDTAQHQGQAATLSRGKHMGARATDGSQMGVVMHMGSHMEDHRGLQADWNSHMGHAGAQGDRAGHMDDSHMGYTVCQCEGNDIAEAGQRQRKTWSEDYSIQVSAFGDVSRLEAEEQRAGLRSHASTGEIRGANTDRYKSVLCVNGEHNCCSSPS